MILPSMAAARERVGDLRQIAGARLLAFADGPERGGRVLALSSGGGLDLWVTVDRSFDIGPVWHRGRPVAWQGAAGYPDARLVGGEADGGRGFNRAFGGFLATCGLEHIRAATPSSPQHGRLPYTPARLRAYGEDWDAAEPVLFAEGEVVQARYGGEAFRLVRRIEVPIGGTGLRVSDVVENLSAERQPHALLYHLNVGWPALDDGARVVLDGAEIGPPIRLADPDVVPAVACRAAGPGLVEAALLSGDGAPILTLRYDSATLPFLQTWTDLRPRAGVLAVEPCTNARAADGGNLDPITMGAGERRAYALTITFGAG